MKLLLAQTNICSNCHSLHYPCKCTDPNFESIRSKVGTEFEYSVNIDGNEARQSVNNTLNVLLTVTYNFFHLV